MTKSKVAEFEIGKMRFILDAPLAEELWWNSLERRDRIGLLRLGDINIGLHEKPWTKLNPSHQSRIIQIAVRASKWAQLIVGDPKFI